jgi:hypothetical protein
VTPYNLGIAYILWAVSGFGALGLHRFYLGKYGTGALWLLTGGLGMVGAVIDFFRLPSMVKDANLTHRYHSALFSDSPPPLRPVAIAPKAESVEHAILRVARRNKGPVSPSEVALETETSIDEAKKHLDTLVEKGHAELRVRKSGQLVYVIPDFLDKNANHDFEEF